MMKSLALDGVYTNDPSTKIKFGNTNIQRLEERLVRERPTSLPAERKNRKFDYFKRNGELKIHHDLLAWELTRPIDISVTDNPNLLTRKRSAILCERSNAKKLRHYGLQIVIGKLSLRDHPILKPEERCAMKLRQLFEEHERTTSLGMIPFYRSRIRSLVKEKKQHEKRKRDGAVDEQEGIFIDETLRSVKLKLKREK